MSGFCASHILYVCAQKPDKPRHLLQPWQARQDYFWDSVCLQGYINHYWSLSGKNVGVLIRTALSSCWQWLCNLSANHRRRIYTEKKAKVVAAVWGTEFIEFLAALAILHQDDLKTRMNLSFFHIILVQLILFFISSWCKIGSLCGKESNKFCPPKSSDDFCPFFPSSIAPLIDNLTKFVEYLI